MRTIAYPLIVWATGLLLAVPARAQSLSGDEVVKRMDEAMTRAQDQSFDFDLITVEPGKGERRMTYHVDIKGTSFRRVEFLSPGDVKGMRMLVVSVNQMYVYMPAFRKVRRIASHVRNQGFMGTAYSYDEMSIVTYGDVFSAKLLSESDKDWTVELIRRPGQEFSYPKLKMVVSKEYSQPTRIEYFSDKGVMLKSEDRTNYECADNLCNPREMKLVDHTRNDLTTRMVRKSWKRNSGIPDSFFTQRALQKAS